ncbi:MAG: alpha/beta fold hydrolase [Armatimonadetes bacterium]|nr:alpha/beta fold hydrolase [Armatimonadota bacterium]
MSRRDGTTAAALPWLAEVQTPPASLPADAPRLSPLMVDGAGRPIATVAAWERRRAELREQWLDYMGRFPEERGPVSLTVLEEDRDTGCVRQLVQYESEPGLPVEGYLLFPENPEGSVPGVVVLHSTITYSIRQPAGLEGPESLFFALKLAQRGYAAFAPRCFSFQYREPGSRDVMACVHWLKARRPDVRGMAKLLHDARRAVDVLESLPIVDRERIGAIGHSLGGKEALYLAAFDERVKATVSSEGGVGLAFCNWHAPWYLGEEIRREGFPMENHQVLALVAPRAFLLLGGNHSDGDRSWPFIEAVQPVYRLYGAEERIGLLNHRQGHAVPPEAGERAYAWLDHFLGE